MPINARLFAAEARHVSCRHVRQPARAAQRRYLNHYISRAELHIEKLPHDGSSPEFFRLAVKDNIATGDPSLPTTCASPILAGHASPFEATIVTQLRARGAVLTGKTNLDEFGMGSHSTHSTAGPVRRGSSSSDNNSGGDDNTTGSDLSVGGSSGGSAEAIRAGEADVALGTDTGGSVRLPAAYTGTVGFKPSYGMLSRFGVVPYANSLDTVGLLARTASSIHDLIVGSGLFAENDPRDPTSLSTAARQRCAADRDGYDNPAASRLPAMSSLTFGIPLEYNIEELDPRIRDGWATAASQLREAGAKVVPVSLPSTRHALSAYYVIAPAEASSNLAKYDGVRYGQRDATGSDADRATTPPAAGGQDEPNAAEAVLYAPTRGAGFGTEVKRRILLGSYTLSSEAMDNYFLQAQRVRRLVCRDFDRVFRLDNPLHDERHFDLAEMDGAVELESKLGPPQVDFLLCPTAPTFPPRLEDVMRQTPVDAYMNDVFTVPASLAGLPAISVPMAVPGLSAVDGRQGGSHSAGLQLIGQYWDDARLLTVAEMLHGKLPLQ